jgi:prepilin-type N-terminal cleavage/methylation domain-containing protein
MRSAINRTPTLRAGVETRRGGFTMVELMIVTAVMLMVLGSVATIIHQSGRLFSDQVHRFSIDEAGRHLIDRVAEQLRGAETATFKPLALTNSPWVSFQQVIDYVNGAPVLSPPVTLEIQLAPGEIKNGKDDNGDGRIDEGFLVATGLGAAPIRLSGNVMAATFNPITNGMAFTVTMGVTDHGRLIQKTFYQEVFLRN